MGVARQYSGTAGRVEDCQVGAFAACASRWGQALVDRRLCLPRAWAEDDARRAKAQVPEETAFATKPAIAGAMLADLLDAGLPVRWVLAAGFWPLGPGRWVLAAGFWPARSTAPTPRCATCSSSAASPTCWPCA